MSKKIRVAFLGSRPLGYRALSILKNMENVEVVAAMVKEPSTTAWWKEDPASIAESKINSHRELVDIDFDFGVSVNYWKIIEPDLVNKPKLGFINLHHSFNLCLRGRDMTSHAILEARRHNRWYHGTTLHYTDDGLDTGPIIETRACDITEFDTAWTLFNKVESLGANLLSEWLPRLIYSRAPVCYPEPENTLNKKTVATQKFIEDIHADPTLTYDTVRAFDFNGFYPSASTIIDATEVALTTDAKLGDKALLRLDERRAVYQLRKA